MKIQINESTQASSAIAQSFGKDIVLPLLLWGSMIIAFLNIKHIPLELSETNGIVLRQFAKVVFTILLPLGIIYSLYREKADLGIYFPPLSNSFKLAFKAFSAVGPACMSFLLIGALGWGFGDWPGAAILSLAFLVAVYFIPQTTILIKANQALNTPNKRIRTWVILSLSTVAVTYLTLAHVPMISNMMYYVFIVGFGEELLFRGYIQSSMNQYFGKTFKLGDVQFGWGLVLAAVLFGLSHALVTVPPTWPWAIWTFILGLGLGYIREKDGSVLGAVLLHAMMDFPLVFFTVT